MNKYAWVSLSLLVLAGCASIPPRSSAAHSVVCYRLYAHGLMSSSNVSRLVLKNTVTKSKYKSAYKSNYVFLADVPAGKYVVDKLEIPFATVKVVLMDRMDTLFVGENQVLFLGDYDVYFKPGVSVMKFEFKEVSHTGQEKEVRDVLAKLGWDEAGTFSVDDKAVLTQTFNTGRKN